MQLSSFLPGIGSSATPSEVSARDCAGQLRVEHRRLWRRPERAELKVVLLKVTHVCSALDTQRQQDAKRLGTFNRVRKAAVIDEAVVDSEDKQTNATAAHSACSSAGGSHCSAPLRATRSMERARRLEPPSQEAALVFSTGLRGAEFEVNLGWSGSRSLGARGTRCRWDGDSRKASAQS